MNLLDRLLVAQPPPFAVLYRPQSAADLAEILFGELVTVERLAELPEPASEQLPVLALVPYRQIRERGFEAIDDGVPMLALRARERAVLPLADLIAALPDGPQSFRGTGFDVPDDEYEETVRTVLNDEIAEGAGSNFVIHRCLTGRVDEPPALAALIALKRLLLGERHAYWTFVVHTPDSTFVGASPERHVSVSAGIALMNPISGTLRYPQGGWSDPDKHRAAVLEFLADPKERDELAMVVDEELKMMAVVGDRGGQVQGPYLKEMAHLAHTEYLLRGRTSLDVRQVLAATMFAPTVTGSPIRNACRVIARHERRGRRYYAGVLALIGQDADGRQSLDAPILIRTAELRADGVVAVAAGATLVRGSRPADELAETRAKAAGILRALSPDEAGVPAGRGRPAAKAIPGGAVFPGGAALSGSAGLSRSVGLSGSQVMAEDAAVVRELAARNRTLARFWLHERSPLPAVPASGPVVRVIDAEDDFTGMLAHLIRSAGYPVSVHPWNSPAASLAANPAANPAASLAANPAPSVAANPAASVAASPAADLATGTDDADLVILGPGPGDPLDLRDPRIRALHDIGRARLVRGAPVLGICLGHQILSHLSGLRVVRLPRPDQGRQTGIDLFGLATRVGFYNSYVVQAPGVDLDVSELSFSLDADRERVHALRGPAMSGLQFHPESVLTTNGLQILTTELGRLAGEPYKSRALE